ncbi:MAG TPA: magnesium transporter CorA family protein [Candidatus Paceibacterota bacterium]|nr:magnesium transporter CorA family protein [Candidatus Paceibacterota bacterium]
MIKKYEYRNLVWIDLENPSSNEVRAVMDEYAMEPLVAEELLIPSLKPKVDLYNNCIYLILHFPILKYGQNSQKNQEIDFVIGRNFLVTSRYEEIDPLHQFSRVFEVNSILDRSNMGEHAGFIFYYMIRNLYRYLIDQLDSIKSSLAQVEDHIFKGEEREMVIELSQISRTLLDFKEATSVHKSVLDSLAIAGKKFFGPDFEYYLQSIISEYFKVHTEIQGSKEFVEELRTTNNSLLTTKQNEVMKTLTIMAFIFLPLSFIASIFGMNSDYLPIVGSPNGFWIILGSMLVIGLCIFSFFKYKKWL